MVQIYGISIRFKHCKCIETYVNPILNVFHSLKVQFDNDFTYRFESEKPMASPRQYTPQVVRLNSNLQATSSNSHNLTLYNLKIQRDRKTLTQAKSLPLFI